MSQKYDSTVARIAGNLLSGRCPSGDGQLSNTDEYAVIWAVGMARAIVAEVRRTESPSVPATPEGGPAPADAPAGPPLLFLAVLLQRKNSGEVFNEMVATPSIALLHEYVDREGLRLLMLSGVSRETMLKHRDKAVKLRATDQGVRRCRKGLTDDDMQRISRYPGGVP